MSIESKASSRASDSDLRKSYGRQRTIFIRNISNDFCQDCDSDEDEVVKLQPSDPNADVPAEYWQVQKLVKYIKCGDQTATTVCLAYLSDYNLQDPWIQMAIRDIGGLEVLTNLLETQHYHCMSGSLMLLCSLAKHSEIQQTLIELGIIPTIVRFLERGQRNLQAMAAYMTSKLTRLKKGRHNFFAAGGLPLLITLLEVPSKLLEIKEGHTKDEIDTMWAATCGAKALFELTYCKKVKKELYVLGIIKIISKLLKAVDDKLVQCTMGILQNCASEKIYQKAIETEDMIESILCNLDSDNMKLRELCLRAIFRSCEGPIPRRLVYTHRGTDKLANLLKKNPDKSLLNSLTGSIWKCSKLDDMVIEFNKHNVISKMVPLFLQEDNMDEEVLVNIAGALYEMARMSENRKVIQKSGALKPAVSYLFRTNPELLENVLNLLGECAHEIECMTEMESYDAVRFIWSMLKNPSNVVKASACRALVPCIRNATDSGELVRSLVGSLELVIKVLHSEDDHVLGSVCAAIAEIATDTENLAIITELGVVQLLANLCQKTDEFLTTNLALAIAGCCECRDNCHQFGQLGVVPPVVENLKNASSTSAATAGVKALCSLSKDPFNCIVMHRNGAVPLLFDAVESNNKQLQQAAAGCLYNLRKLALKADVAKHHIHIQ